jgi:RNA polymerase sigma factor (sigma-70 family)
VLDEQTLCNEHLPLAKHIARRYTGRGVDWDDLIQEGLLGLIYAARSYDRDSHPGVEFRGYAASLIENRMKQALRNSETVILPNHVWTDRKLIRRALRRAGLTEDCEPAAVAELTGLSKRRVKAALKPDLKRSGTQLDTLCRNSDSPDPEFWDELRAVLESLDPRDREIVTLRIGLNRKRHLTYQQIGQRFGLTGETCRNVCRRAATLLKARLSGGPPRRLLSDYRNPRSRTQHAG